jgi:signal transduction histidine kinase
MAPKPPEPGEPDEPAADRPSWREPEPDAPRIAKGTRDLGARVLVPGAPALREDVAAIVHDLKNPLAVILLETAAIEQRLAGRLPIAVARGLERIAVNAAYVERMIAGLLDLVASDEAHLELRRERVDLALLVRGAIERSVASTDLARVAIEIREPLVVEGDAMRLERVVANLVGNALQYSAAGVRVTVRVDRRDPHACVSVIDAGEGLTADQVATCFDRYRRSERGGHGLGLYICRRIIEAHHGRIGVQSTPGRGARFYFMLPLP